VPHSVLQMQWIQQPRYDAQRLPQSLSLESAAPSAFNRQHCYLLDYQHISMGDSSTISSGPSTNFEHPPHEQTPTHPPLEPNVIPTIIAPAILTPSITRLNVDSPSTANQHVKDIHSQNSNQGSSTALRRASGRFPKSSWTDDSRRGSLIQEADRRRLLNARGTGDLSPVEIIVNVDKDSLTIKECPFQTARWVRQKNSGAMQKVLVRKP